jgi:hypothetical protein
MFIDVVNAGWGPIYDLNLSEDVPTYIQAAATALSYPWTHFICGHPRPARHRHDEGPLAYCSGLASHRGSQEIRDRFSA